MSVIIRLQGLPWTASAGDIRLFFEGLNIPDGGVHIVGGERGDAFIAFTSDEDARLAMQNNNRYLQDSPVQLLLSSKTEMQNVITQARDGHVPKPAANTPARPNMPPAASRQNLPRHGDSYPRQDISDRGRDGQRRPPNVPPYDSRGHRDEQRYPPENITRGMRGDVRQPPDVPPSNFRGSRDDRHPSDTAPSGMRGGRDAPQPPNQYPPGQRGQREAYRNDFPPRSQREYPDEPRQGGPPQRRPPESSQFRDPQVDRTGRPDGPNYRDDQRPPSDISRPGSRGFRDSQRNPSDRHSSLDHRDMRESPHDRLSSETQYHGPPGNLRDGPKRPRDQNFDPIGGPSRDYRGEGRRESGIILDGPADIRNDYSGDGLVPEGLRPRNYGDIPPRNVQDGQGPRDTRNIPPLMRPDSEDRRNLMEPAGPNRRDYRDDPRMGPDRSGAPPQTMREGQRLPISGPESGIRDYRDQDRRGPPPQQRYRDEGRPSPDRRRPDIHGPGHRPPPPRERGPPLHGGFPQDHDARVTPRYEDDHDRQHYGNYAEPLYQDEQIQYTGQLPNNEPYHANQARPIPDWDGRPPRDTQIPVRPPQSGFPPDGPRNRTRNHMGDQPYEQSDMEGFAARSNARALLPDPDLPRRDPSTYEDCQDEQFNNGREYGGDYDRRQFDNNFGNDYPIQQEMMPVQQEMMPAQQELMPLQQERMPVQHERMPVPQERMEHRQEERGSYPHRGRVQGVPQGRQPLHGPPVTPPGLMDMCIRISNMPTSVTYSGLRRFFENSMIPRDGVKLLNDTKGQRIGVGFARFLNLAGMQNALGMDGKLMDGLAINIVSCSTEEFENAVDSYTPPARALSPKRHHPDRGFQDRSSPSPKRRRSISPVVKRDSQARKTRHIALLRDVPYRATVQDIKMFFNQLDIAENGSAILFDQDSSGKPNGIVFIEFSLYRDLSMALQRNHSRFLNRTINISVGEARDYERVVEKKRNFGGSHTTRSSNSAPSGDGNDKNQKSETIPNKNESTTPKTETPQKPVNNGQPNISCFCVHVKGLPPTVTKKDVEEFFKGMDIAPKGYNPISRKDGSCTGDAFIEFLSPKECQKATAKDQQKLGNYSISVKPVSKANMVKDIQELRKKATEEGPPPSQPQRAPPLYFMLGAQNLPYSVSIGEILNFFRGYNPVPESIRLHYTNEGRPTGDAVIGFMTESECHRALRDLNSRMLGRRNVRLYLA